MKQLVDAQSRTKERQALCWLAGAILVWAFISSHATMSVDPPSRYLEAKALVETGSFAVTPLTGEGIPPGVFSGKDGQLYSYFGKVQSVFFAGPYWFCTRVLDIQSDKLIRSLTALTLFPLLLTMLGLAFYFLLKEFDFSPRASLTGALLVVFATGIWQTSKEAQEEPILALFYVLAVYGLRRYQKSASLFSLLTACLAIAAAILTRTDTLPTIFCFLLITSWLILRQQKAGPKIALHRLAALLIVMGCLGYATALQIGINLLLFGHPISAIDDQLSWFSWSILPMGLKGLLISPGRGLIWFNPFVLLTILGLPWLWKHHRSFFFLITGSFLGCLLLHAAYPVFHGNCCWGPRYLIRHMPLLLLVACLFGLTAGSNSVLRRYLFATVMIISVLVQLLAVSMHHTREILELDAAYPGSWSDRQFTMYEPQAHVIPRRIENLTQALHDMTTGNIPPWPTGDTTALTEQEKLDAPVLRYLAFWPCHLTYYLPAVRPGLAAPLWLSSSILLGGILLGTFCCRRAYRLCPATYRRFGPEPGQTATSSMPRSAVTAPALH